MTAQNIPRAGLPVGTALDLDSAVVRVLPDPRAYYYRGRWGRTRGRFRLDMPGCVQVGREQWLPVTFTPLVTPDGVFLEVTDVSVIGETQPSMDEAILAARRAYLEAGDEGPA